MRQRFILIRPAGQNESLARRFRDEGIEPLVCPVLEIVPHEIDNVQRQRVMNLDAYDHVIFVSKNAVSFGLPLIDQHWPQLPSRLKWYAIGQATAAALAAEGIEAMTPALATSEGLLEMKSLQSLTSTRVLIFRGRGGRTTLAEGLVSRGASVDYVEVYERRAVSVPDALRDAVNSAGAGVVLAYSAESLQAFSDALALDRNRVALVVPSERLREAAITLGFETIFVAMGPDDDAMYTAAQRARTHQS